MDTSGPLTSMQVGSGFAPEELGMRYQIERSRFNYFEIRSEARKILKEERYHELLPASPEETIFR